MLMPVDKNNLMQVREDLKSDGLHIGDLVDYGAFNPLVAEVVHGISPAWHLVETHPNQESTAAAHLVARRFGVFVPESEHDIIRRGRKRHVTRLMFTGYLFVFVWSVLYHRDRIEACPGVKRIVNITMPDGSERPAVVSDKEIDQIRSVENGQRPLPAILMPADISRPKSKKKHKSRKKKKELVKVDPQRDDDIVACYAWSPFQRDLLTLDEQGRNGALRKALGLS